MKHLIPISTLLLVSCGPALSQEPDWKEFASKEGGFKVLMLGAPRAEEQQVRSPAGPLVNRLFVTQTAKEEVVYLVSYAEYPEDALKQFSPEQILEAARTGTVENLKGKLASDQKITLAQKHAGREFVVEIPNAAQYKARIYMVDRRLYQVVMVTASKELATSKEAQKFFDSFTLLDR